MSGVMTFNPNSNGGTLPINQQHPAGSPTNIFGDVTIVSSHQYQINPNLYYGNIPNGMNPMVMLMKMQQALIETMAVAKSVQLLTEYAKESSGKVESLEGPNKDAPRLIGFDKTDAVDVTTVENKPDHIEAALEVIPKNNRVHYISPNIYLSLLDKANYGHFVQEHEGGPVMLALDASDDKTDKMWKEIFAEKLTKHFNSVIKSGKIKITDNTEFVVFRVDNEGIQVEGIQKNIDGNSDDIIIEKFQNYGFLKGLGNWINDESSNCEDIDPLGRGLSFSINAYTIDSNKKVVVNPIADIK